MTIRMWRPLLVSLPIISTQINQKLRSDFTGKSPTFLFTEVSSIVIVCFILSGHVALDFLPITELRMQSYCNHEFSRTECYIETNHNKVAQLSNQNLT